MDVRPELSISGGGRGGRGGSRCWSRFKWAVDLSCRVQTRRSSPPLLVFYFLVMICVQIPNNLAMHLHEGGANIMGTSPDMIDNAEDRQALRRGVDSLETSLRETLQACACWVCKELIRRHGCLERENVFTKKIRSFLPILIFLL